MTVPAPVSSPDADGLVLAGLDAHRAGRLDDARAFYARALAATPAHADALNLSGAIAFAAGRNDAAIRLIGKAIKAKPDHIDAYLNLAEAYEASGRRADAIATCQKALALAPDFAEAHARLALLVASDGRATLALRHARVALALDPDAVEALCGKGIALAALRQFDDADAAYARALALAPDDLRALTGHASLLRDTDFIADALALYRRAVAVKPGDAALMASLAGLIELDGDVVAARDLFAAALAIDPESPEIRFSYGRCLRDAGDFAAAATVFAEVLARHPKYGPAHLALVRLKRLPDTPAERKALARLTGDASLPPRQRVQAGFAHGELLDRAGEYDAAFARFAEANAIHARARHAAGERFHRAELAAQIDLIDRTLAREYVADTAGWGNPTELPVFVVGLPRSGTTLIEQICASHSQVAGLGELRSIQRAARNLAAHNEGRARLGDWDRDFARGEADRHVAALADRAPGVLRAVDKNPYNLMRLGLIGALFPRARVIRCHRDLRDVGVSHHTLFFGQGNTHSNDLGDCGFAVRAIDGIGAIWARELRLDVLDVVYEDLVSDLEPQVRRIVDFLGLPWEDACLDFHRTERHVNTPSSWQVRQPVYLTSVGRWRRFEKHLAPMLAALSA